MRKYSLSLLLLVHLDDINFTHRFPYRFPSLSHHVYPNFREHSEEFAASNDVFLSSFFPALHKMSLLGVDSSNLKKAGCCKCNSEGANSVVYNENFFADQARDYKRSIEYSKSLGNIYAHEKSMRDMQHKRRDEIRLITTPLNKVDQQRKSTE